MRPMTTDARAVPIPSSGGRLVTSDGRPMALRGCSLEAEARAGLARVILRQTFLNDAAEPLQATYQFPLPADAAVGGYSVVMEGCRVVGEIERREAAREQYEQAILEGRTAGLVEQERSSVFTQEIGNIPPQTEVVCELEIDQPLRWLEDGQWEWRFPTAIAPRYMGADGRVADGERLIVDVAESDRGARARLTLQIGDELVGAPGSPSHRLRAGEDGRICFACEEGEPLDRDVVVRWAVATADVGVAIDAARPEDGPLASAAYGVVTLVPPRAEAGHEALARDLILLLDTSASMHDEPLERAKEVATAIIESMGAADRLEMIEFSSTPRRWRPEPSLCDEQSRAEARAWIGSLQASGCTEMTSALTEALQALRPEAQRQVVLITDGLVGFDDEVVGEVRAQTPAGCRVHAVGIGSAANRSLTHAVAAAGRGGEVLVDLDEDAVAAAARVVARLSRPLVVNVRVRGSAVVETAGGETRDLLAGAPAMIPVKLRPEGGTLVVEGEMAGGRAWRAETTVAPIAPGDGRVSLVRVVGRAYVERLELEAAMGSEVDTGIEQAGLEYRIATRLTSWIAIAEEPGVDPRAPIRRVRIAQQLPRGMSAGGLGLEERVSQLMRSYSSCFVQHCVAAPDHSPDHSPPLPAPVILTTRIISRRGDRLVLEMEADQEFDWEPYAQLFSASVDSESTTRAGRYGPGQRIRLTLVGVSTTIRTSTIERMLILWGDLEVRIVE